MKHLSLIMISILLYLAVGTARSNSIDEASTAQRIVVLNESEGIVYAHFCAFYELRALIADGLSGAKEDEVGLSSPMYELRMLSRSGESTVYIGDHWIQSSDGMFSLSSEVFERIVELVSSREGRGIPLSKVEAYNAKAIRQFRRPDYKEDNRCLRSVR
ncbi:hypothetical protein [Gilvimarinus algae]|uniref:Uncharacterized protein n=1 Tax=Gilvimarinus algae TaxID=3058037 RepID=A0ABT8TCC8_9GAMM|nr:hypothetical protein [Gilvimarinus sp. SDUM040014]MDO3381249.1 hypothetical protein [Gilvimarinus sp. SDUM040014]